jgi:hypothetical protein
MIDLDAALADLKAQYFRLGADAPDLAALLGAAGLTLTGEGENVTVPRWVLAELTRTLARYMSDSGMTANAKPKTRAPRRPRREELRPLAAAKALAPHLERWKAVVRIHARGKSLEAAYYEVGKQLGKKERKERTIEDSYRLIEQLRKRTE